MTPAFSPDVHQYTVLLPATEANLTLTGTPVDQKASLTPNNGTLTLSNITLGTTISTIFRVRAENGNSTDYNISVIRGSNNSKLSSLTLNYGSLTPAFNPDVLNYQISISAQISTLTVTGYGQDNHAQISANNGVPQALAMGANQIQIVVTSQDKTSTTTYTVTATRELSSVADLSNIQLSSGILSPAFSKDVTSYTASVGINETSITITGTKANYQSTISANNGVAQPLVRGYNTISLVVTSENGLNTKTYTITVYRQQSTNTTMSSIVVAYGGTNQTFYYGTINYTATVPNNITSATVTGYLQDSTATVSSNNGAIINLNVGTQTVTLTVTAEDGTTKKDYVVSIIRTGASNSKLSDITPSSGWLSPAFNSATTNYRVAVPYSTTQITLTGTLQDPNGTLTDFPTPQNLAVGSNTFYVKGTAEDGVTQTIYVVSVYRLENFEFVSVPAGAYSTTGVASFSYSVSAFSMGKSKVTRHLYEYVMEGDPTRYSASASADGPVCTASFYNAIAFCNKLSLVFGLQPVYTVLVNGTPVDWKYMTNSKVPYLANSDWNAVTADFSQNGYRLPTEHQWTWAAMGAPATGQSGSVDLNGYNKAYAGATGTSSTLVGNYAWYGSNAASKSQQVKTKLANELGLYDMSGNVEEWCWDWYAAQPITSVTNYTGPATGTQKVAKGGSWNNSDLGVEINYRGYTYPYTGYDWAGFRLVKP